MNVQLYLNVGFEQRERAKALGARFDSAMKQWYVPHGRDINLFKEWWPAELRKQLASLHDAPKKKPKNKNKARPVAGMTQQRQGVH